MVRHQIPLRYSGKRWSRVQIADRFQSYEPPDSPTGDPKPVSWVRLEVGGETTARDIVIAGAGGFWRTFASLNMSDDAEILSFVDRYGEPQGLLEPGVRVLTTEWSAHQKLFGLIARRWALPDESKVSRYITGGVYTDFFRSSDRFIADVELEVIDRVQLRADATLGLVAHFTRLIDFMLASAFSQMMRQAPMRQCDRCGHWYEIQKTTSKTCSAACRVALSRQRKEQN